MASLLLPVVYVVFSTVHRKIYISESAVRALRVGINEKFYLI